MFAFAINEFASYIIGLLQHRMQFLNLLRSKKLKHDIRRKNIREIYSRSWCMIRWKTRTETILKAGCRRMQPNGITGFTTVTNIYCSANWTIFGDNFVSPWRCQLYLIYYHICFLSLLLRIEKISKQFKSVAFWYSDERMISCKFEIKRTKTGCIF